MRTRPALAAITLATFLAGCAATDPAGGEKTRPREILLIRHAEKPVDPADFGLSPVGRERAAALPSLFDQTRTDPFPVPDVIFAAKRSRRSNRSVETVTPLSEKLGLRIDTRFADDDYPTLAAELRTDPKYAGKTVLVCWHHGNLPELAAALGAAGVPGRWKEGEFGRVWVVGYDARGDGRPLGVRSQRLLPGDAER